MLTDEQIAEGRSKFTRWAESSLHTAQLHDWLVVYGQALLDAASENAKLHAALSDERRKREVLAGEVRAARGRAQRHGVVADGWGGCGPCECPRCMGLTAARAATDASGALEKP